MEILPDAAAYFQIVASAPATAAVAGLAALFLLAVTLRRKRRAWHTCLRPSPILTANEREFFHRLTRALPTYNIFPQVALSALIATDPRLSARRQFAIRRNFGWKYADFVLCAPHSLDVLCIIELDDRTHTARADRECDAMTKAAGYQTLRFQSRHKPSVAELAEHFARLLPTLQTPCRTVVL